MRTPLTYYGGKQMLAPALVEMFPPHRIYVEPFAGGAAVLFHKRPVERETLNDLDGEVVRFWRALRDHPEALADAVAATPYSREEWREADLPTDDDVEAARRFLVRIDQSFSRSRESWSPPSLLADRRGRWQPGTWQNLPPKLLAAAVRLQGVAIERADAIDVIRRWDVPDCLIYADPPYAGPLRTAPSKGYREDAPDLWPRLVEALLAVEHAHVVLSGYPCPEAVLLEQAGWRREQLARRKTVQARDGSSLDLAPETVWLSPGIERELTLLVNPAGEEETSNE